MVVRNVKVPKGSVITLLGVEGKLKYQVKGSDVVIETPDLTGDQLPCLHAYTFKIPGGKL